MFLGTLKYGESDEQYCSSKKIYEICIFGFQIYQLFFKTRSNGLSNKFIPTLSLIKPLKNVCNLWTLVLGCSRKHGHWDTHDLLKYSQTKIQIFEQSGKILFPTRQMHNIIFTGLQSVLLFLLREYVVTSGLWRFYWIIGHHSIKNSIIY